MSTTWEDPPEYRDPGYGGQGGGPSIQLPAVGPYTKLLLWTNGIVFAISLLVPALVGYFSLVPGQWVDTFPFVPFWQVLTYGFLHSQGDIGHLLFNLLGIYFFGSMLEGIVGSRRYLAWYLTAVVVGALLQLASGVVEYMAGGLSPQVLGASGGVLFLVAACATLRPNALVIFILFPMRLKTLALIAVGIDVFGLLSGATGKAYLVHLGGAALGFAAVKLRWIWVDPVEKVEEHRQASAQRSAVEDAQRLDALLKQIHEQGIGSLSKREKDFLKRMSSRK